MMGKSDVFALGIGLAVIGGLLIAMAYGTSGGTGRDWTLLAGSCVSGVGGLLTQVGLIAWAVEIGTRPLQRTAPAAPVAPGGRPAWTSWLVGGAVVLTVGVLVAAGVLAGL